MTSPKRCLPLMQEQLENMTFLYYGNNCKTYKCHHSQNFRSQFLVLGRPNQRTRFLKVNLEFLRLHFTDFLLMCFFQRNWLWLRCLIGLCGRKNALSSATLVRILAQTFYCHCYAGGFSKAWLMFLSTCYLHVLLCLTFRTCINLIKFAKHSQTRVYGGIAIFCS